MIPKERLPPEESPLYSAAVEMVALAFKQIVKWRTFDSMRTATLSSSVVALSFMEVTRVRLR